VCRAKCTLQQQLKMHKLLCSQQWRRDANMLAPKAVRAWLRCAVDTALIATAMLLQWSGRAHFTVGAFSPCTPNCIMTKTSAVLCIALVSSQHVYARRGDVLSRARSTSVLLIFESELKHVWSLTAPACFCVCSALVHLHCLASATPWVVEKPSQR
jgi:hypothetical protein